ncbi:hypothetical protein ABID52_002222 [Fictibacillus halophilus]|uniref:Uncharacterized protein n=1 Tax=Fictibacillus halophilus TaxID=1610490 RepID=A0ABV2LJW1_9BACL|nr:hypothetical protein [Fictibacillus halophilus]
MMVSKLEEIRLLLANKLMANSSTLVKTIEGEENLQFVLKQMANITQTFDELIATLDDGSLGHYESYYNEETSPPHDRVEHFVEHLSSSEITRKIKKHKESTLDSIKVITDEITRKRILK